MTRAPGPQGAAAAVTPAPEGADSRRELWEDAGVIRSAEGLERLLTAPTLLPRLIARAALERRESRGAHFRSDYPTEDEAWVGHVVLRRDERPGARTMELTISVSTALSRRLSPRTSARAT